MKKQEKFYILEKIVNLQDIPGNHPNQPENRGFIYLECDKIYFEKNFNSLFSFDCGSKYGYCFLSENCEISFNNRIFCGVSFKGEFGKDNIAKLVKEKLHILQIAYAEIANGYLHTSKNENIPLSECEIVIYDYDLAT